MHRRVEVEEGRLRGFDEVTVPVGVAPGRKQRVQGVLLVDWTRSDKDGAEHYRVYRTRSGRFAVHLARPKGVVRTAGIVTRLRTTPVAPVAVLGGHVAGAVVQTLLAGAGVLGVAVLRGFGPGADALGWLGQAGFSAYFGLTLAWLSVAMGAAARSVGSASNTPMIFLLLPFLGSGFVPVETMPPVVRWVAEHQPFTSIIETIRGLLAGTAVPAATVWTALGWCAGPTLLGWWWARLPTGVPRL